MSIKANALTMGKSNPSHVDRGGGYRYRGDQEWPWPPGDPRWKESLPRNPGPGPAGKHSIAAKQKRLREFTEHRQRCAACGHVAPGNRVSTDVFKCLACGDEKGVSVSDAGELVEVNRKTAKAYERLRLAAIQEPQQ